MEDNIIRENPHNPSNPRFRRYPEYKESGVEWIGGVPAHWEVLKVKHVGLSNPSKNNPKTASLKEEPVVFLPMERVHTDGTIDQELTLSYSQLKNGYTYFEEGDILIAKVTPCFENGKIVHIKNLATPVGFGSTEFIVIRPDLKKVFPPFLYYILRNEPLRSIGKHFMSSAVGLKRVPTEFVENFHVSIPIYQEQTQIANFLDCKTEQIDELIRIKERRIELLQEQRTALINQAVTKGLDPNVEMKPSSVEWIGEIPKHWTITRLKYISNIPVTYGLNIESDRYTTEGIRLIRITDIDESGDLRRNGVYLPEDCVPQEQMLNSYDLLLSRSGATVGKSYLHLETGKYTSAGYLVRFNFNDYWISKFIYYVTLSHFYRNWLEQQIIISTIQNVNGEKYSNFQLPIPSYEEQTQIVDFLDYKTEQIDELIATEQRKIELLKEYRQSLISEAVTGKIDVRSCGGER